MKNIYLFKKFVLLMIIIILLSNIGLKCVHVANLFTKIPVTIEKNERYLGLKYPGKYVLCVQDQEILKALGDKVEINLNTNDVINNYLILISYNERIDKLFYIPHFFSRNHHKFSAELTSSEATKGELNVYYIKKTKNISNTYCSTFSTIAYAYEVEGLLTFECMSILVILLSLIAIYFLFLRKRILNWRRNLGSGREC